MTPSGALAIPRSRTYSGHGVEDHIYGNGDYGDYLSIGESGDYLSIGELSVLLSFIVFHTYPMK